MRYFEVSRGISIRKSYYPTEYGIFRSVCHKQCLVVCDYTVVCTTYLCTTG